jgi:hypothetical protein
VEVDELQNGEERLVAEIDQACARQDFAIAKSKIEQFRERHPEWKKNAQYQELAGVIEWRLAVEELRVKKER